MTMIAMMMTMMMTMMNNLLIVVLIGYDYSRYRKAGCHCLLGYILEECM